MKAVIVSGVAQQPATPINTEIVDQDIPTPGDDQVLIKVAVAGSNPKDWKVLAAWGLPAHNSGDDLAGTIEKVGKNVTEFKVGDRVAAFHEMMKPDGAFAEYAIAFATTTFHIPASTSFEEAATIPLAALTAVYGLFDKLALPTPLHPAESEIPLLIYGASTAVGVFAIKLAKMAGIHPIIGLAGSGVDLAKKVGADFVVDRRKGNIVEDIKAVIGDKKLVHVLDAISEGDSAEHISAILANGGTVATVLPGFENAFGENVKVVPEMVGEAHDGTASQKDLAYAFCRMFSLWLADGRFTGHPYEVIEGGLNGVEAGLRKLQRMEVSSKKLVFRIADTPGL